MPTIYFIRHGETDWNKRGLIQGWIDTPMNQKGHGQARAIGQALAGIPGIAAEFQFVVSPLMRTRQTMSHIAAALALSADRVAVEPMVKELGFGVWEGKPFWELKASPVYPADAEQRYFWRPQGGESYEDGRERIQAWIDSLDRPTVVVAHGAIGRCLIGHAGALGPAETVSLGTPQGCYCRLEAGRIEWFDVTGEPA